jgi:hypothetical protein
MASTSYSRSFKLLLLPTLAACGSTTAITPDSGQAGGGGQPDGGAQVDVAPPTPMFIEGGGLGGGPITTTLNVFVADDDTRSRIAGATVRVGGSSDPAGCSATTDSTGLAIFKSETCSLIGGKQSITASKAGYAPSTWIGINAANVTMGIRSMTVAAVDSATITGTITGWDTLPTPAAGHQTLGLVGYSASRTMGDAANNIAQDTREVVVLGVGAFPIPSNLCVKNALVSDCQWRLKTRTGKQAHYAVVIDQDQKGTPDDDTDDTFTVIGWAIKTGLEFQKDAGADGEALTLLKDEDMQSFSVMFPTPLTGLAYIGAFPMLDLGAEGRISIVLPTLDMTHTTTRVPKLAGMFANAHYDFLANLQDEKDKPQPSSLAWSHKVDPTKPVMSLDWLAPPTALKAEAGTFSFTPAPGASVQGGELQAMDGSHAWSITIFDDTKSFTLPGVSPDPLPAGEARFVASALVIPGFKANDVKFEQLQDTLTHIASDYIVFTR